MVSSAILEEKSRIEIAGRGFEISPFSLGTFIKASEFINLLPIIKNSELDTDEKIEESVGRALVMAKDCEIVSDVLVTLLLGDERTYCLRSKGNFIKKMMYKREYRKLRNWVIAIPFEDMYQGIAELIQKSNATSFFVYTTFLTNMNLLKPTKVG